MIYCATGIVCRKVTGRVRSCSPLYVTFWVWGLGSGYCRMGMEGVVWVWG